MGLRMRGKVTDGERWSKEGVRESVVCTGTGVENGKKFSLSGVR